MFDINIKVFSFHNTSPFVLSCQKETYADVINTYSSYFQKQVPYCSDSYGVWRFRRLKEVLAEHTDFNLQILTHPGLWNKKILSPVERVFECVTGRANKIKKYYIDFLNANGREIIDN